MLVLHALTGDAHVVGAAGPGHPTPGWWDGADRAGSRAGHRPLVRRRGERARRLPGHHRPVSAAPDGRPWGVPLPAADRPRPGRRRGRAGRPPRHRPVGAGPRRLDGRHAGAGVGGRAPGPGRRGCSCSPRRADATADQIAVVPRRSSRAIRADPRWRGGDYYDAAAARAASPGWRGPADRAPHLPQRWSWTSGSAGPPQGGEEPLGGRPVRGASPTWTTTPTSWPAGSTPDSYVVLTEAMNIARHRPRSRWRRRALHRSPPTCTGRASTPTGCSRPALQEQIAGREPLGGLTVVHSDYGHDGFLIEIDQVGAVVREALGCPAVIGRPSG